MFADIFGGSYSHFVAPHLQHEATTRGGSMLQKLGFLGFRSVGILQHSGPPSLIPA